MRLSLYLPFFLFTVPATVSACEGECIIAITNAFLGNYTDPVHSVLNIVVSLLKYSLPYLPPKTPSTTTGQANLRHAS